MKVYTYTFKNEAFIDLKLSNMSMLMNVLEFSYTTQLIYRWIYTVHFVDIE